MHAGDTVFLVIHANPDAIRLGLVLREIRVYDEYGQYVAAKHSHMTSAIPGFDASFCNDLKKQTYCSTRVGDQDACIEIEYPIDRGFSRIEVDNYNKQNEGAKIFIYGDHFWLNLLWKNTFQGVKDLHIWSGKNYLLSWQLRLVMTVRHIEYLSALLSNTCVQKQPCVYTV